MRKELILLVSGLTLLLCATTYAGWTEGETVNTATLNEQVARHSETTWPMIVDDSLLIQITWENGSAGTTLDDMKISYRDKFLRGTEWRAEIDVPVTLDDNIATGHGHSSISTYKSYEGRYKTMVGYVGYIAGPIYHNGNEYRGRTWDRSINSWSDFFFISPPFSTLSDPPPDPADDHIVALQHPGKTGNLMFNGNSAVFSIWPYYHKEGSYNNPVMHYRVMTIDQGGESWGIPQTVFAPADTFYQTRCICPYPLPNHDITIAFDRSDDHEVTYNIFVTKYHFGNNSFDTPLNLSNVATGVKAMRAYIVARDKGNNAYTLHAVWEEGYPNGTFAVKYRRGEWNGSAYSWSTTQTLEATNGCYPTVAVTPDGDVYAIWTNNTWSDLYYNYALSPNFAWQSAPQEITATDEDYTYLRAPQAFADKVGNIHLVANGHYGDPTENEVVYFLNDLPPVSPQNLAAISDPHPKFKWSPCGETNFTCYQIRRKIGSQPWESLPSRFNKNDTIFYDPDLDIGHDPFKIYVSYQVTVKDARRQVSDTSGIQFEIYPPQGGPKLAADILPRYCELLPNYPNPFNAQTTIEYALPNEAAVSLSVFDIQGRKMATLSEGMKPAGYHQLIWDAKSMPSGLYLCVSKPENL